jgi:hypothetical protein
MMADSTPIPRFPPAVFEDRCSFRSEPCDPSFRLERLGREDAGAGDGAGAGDDLLRWSRLSTYGFTSSTGSSSVLGWAGASYLDMLIATPLKVLVNDESGLGPRKWSFQKERRFSDAKGTKAHANS